jgi:hypothetical protein
MSPENIDIMIIVSIIGMLILVFWPKGGDNNEN